MNSCTDVKIKTKIGKHLVETTFSIECWYTDVLFFSEENNIHILKYMLKSYSWLEAGQNHLNACKVLYE